MKKRKYILTADDYGLCPEVDAAIEEMAIKGCLSTTNVLVNFGTDFANSPLHALKDFSIGLHWNVTTGRPVTDVAKIPTLVKSNGEFYSIDEFRSRMKKDLIRGKELMLELQNQFDIFKKYFGQPSYWNTHENSSLYPKEFRLFEKVALKNGIRRMRNFQRVYIDYDHCIGWKRKLREFAVRSYVDLFFGILEKKKFVMPAGRIVSFRNDSKTEFDRLKKCLDETNKPSVEIIIHPATRGDNPLFGNIGSDRVIEYEKYMSEEFRALFVNENAEIIPFEKL